MNPSPDKPTADELPFVSHLIELRDRLIRALIGVGICFFILALYPGFGSMYDLLASPLVSALPKGATMIATNVVAPFMVPIKVTMLAALLMALPFVLYQVWAFVAPGLYAKEKRLVLPLVVSSTLLFYVGVAFCYFFVLGEVFHFIQSFAPKSITAAPDIESYLGFVLNMFLAFGMAFEVPVVVVILSHLGIVSVAKLKEWRGYFVVAAFVVAAVVTPPDVFSQLALAIPMCLLYELGIWAAHWSGSDKKENADTAADTAASEKTE